MFKQKIDEMSVMSEKLRNRHDKEFNKYTKRVVDYSDVSSTVRAEVRVRYSAVHFYQVNEGESLFDGKLNRRPAERSYYRSISSVSVPRLCSSR